ncbi:hypothetical protein DCAR_0102249 [Daucus carota subsp. sativus]|uniref:Uncharacterized protein n=1 Tax=Daucus carota subsp. sativus TaxID=79200 RepID=A0AAF0W4G8_DAUCS|nr:PREDICTED: uncharacterized protein LOC108204496 [Daucus carota subsp. sativus]WOG83075.1 hypothetical protein DCAR_0102249 [Daucus carota subsp. sativus]
MADFSFLSDSDDDKKVDDLLSQVMDHSVLEQVSAINCSGFTDSVLPSQLETRFSRLKSFPAAKPMSQISPVRPFSARLEPDSKKKKSAQGDRSSVNEMGLDETREKDLKSKSQHGVLDFDEEVSDFSIESDGWVEKKDGELSERLKVRTRSFRSPLDSRSSSGGSPSPPKGIGCFWCSPKRVLSRKSKEWRADHDRGKNEEFLMDMSDFSTKGQEKLLKKLMKEEEKINREAAKIVKLVKQASARMEISEDELSDDERTK